MAHIVFVYEANAGAGFSHTSSIQKFLLFVYEVIQLKKFLSSILLLCMIFSLCAPAYAVDSSLVAEANSAGSIVTVSTSDGSSMSGTIRMMLYKDGEIIYQADYSVGGRLSVEIGVPVRQIPRGSYVVGFTYSQGDTKIAEGDISITTGVTNPTQTGGMEQYEDGSIGAMRVVMVPYAKVYSNSSCVGTPVAELKRHDLVHIIERMGNVAHVEAYIQSGNGTSSAVSGVDAVYSSADDLIVEGYINYMALGLTQLSYAADKGREVVEVGYTRLGTRGVYSQSRRFMGYYLDCSAFASWCWYQVGINMSYGGNTACSGLAQWAQSQTSNVILWEAEKDTASVENFFNRMRSTYDLGSGSITLGSSKYGSYTDGDVVYYKNKLTADVVEQMQPGDIVFFNYEVDFAQIASDNVTVINTDDETLTFLYTWEEDDSWSETDPETGETVEHSSSYTCYQTIDAYQEWQNIFGVDKPLRVDEVSSGVGYEHVGLFVGTRDDNTLIILESANPTSNTKISEITLAGTRIEDIGMVVRPTGCVKIS